MVTLVLVLLLKFCALWVLVEQGIGAQLLLAPLIGRAAMLGLFLCTPYVRPGGLGQALAEHLPRRIAGWVLLGSALFCLVLGGWVAVLALAMFAWLRHLICRCWVELPGIQLARCWSCSNWLSCLDWR